MATGMIISLLLSFLSVLSIAEAMEYCDGNYWCEEGHCCGQGRCCTYYYEVWWFWLIWCMIALLVGCCFYQQKRLRLRRQLRYRAEVEVEAAMRSELGMPPRAGVETPAIIQHAAATSSGMQTLGPVFNPDKTLRLPSYDEVEHLPKDPPAYNLLYNGPGAQGQSSASAAAPSDEPPPFDAGAYPSLVEYSAPGHFTDNPVHVWAGLPAYVPHSGRVLAPCPHPGASQAPAVNRDIHISNAATIEGPSLIAPPEYNAVPPTYGDSDTCNARSATTLPAPPTYSVCESAAGPATHNRGSQSMQTPHNPANQPDVDERPVAGLLANEVTPSSQRRH